MSSNKRKKDLTTEISVTKTNDQIKKKAHNILEVLGDNNTMLYIILYRVKNQQAYKNKQIYLIFKEKIYNSKY